MLNKILIILTALYFSAGVQPLSQNVLAKEAIVTPQVMIEAKALDKRATILRAYLAQYNSPLQYHAQDFIEAADEYDLDWKLVAAISGTESTFGKFIPGGHVQGYTSYNAWGWGVYGDQSLGFKSWRHGIFTVSEGLRKNYLNRGLNNPYEINRIYAASTTWGSKVTYFMEDIEKFKNNFKPERKIVISPFLELEVAGPSALLASR